jgi:putative SOS response-associated peptidase YedK
MCGRFTLRQRLQDLMRTFNVSAQTEWQYPLRFNIAPTQEIPVVRQTSAGRELTLMRWGLIPSWATDPKIGYSMINSKSETAAEKPSFRSAMKKRRCLIPADGFYEWRKVGKTKQPNLFCRPDDQLFAFAGLWEQWSKGDKPIETCTILTTSANELVMPLHDRMPVILSPNDYAAWLNPETTDPASLAHLFGPLPVDELTAYAVNPVVNNARHEGADCIERI